MTTVELPDDPWSELVDLLGRANDNTADLDPDPEDAGAAQAPTAKAVERLVAGDRETAVSLLITLSWLRPTLERLHEQLAEHPGIVEQARQIVQSLARGGKPLH
jgi:hypothetical protein